jgi:hypothetical protein
MCTILLKLNTRYFGSFVKDNRLWIAMEYCFAQDHQVLTNEGFMFMNQLRDRLLDNRASPLLVAGYDTQSQCMVFEAPLQLIVNETRSQLMVEIAQSRSDKGVFL